MLGYTWLVLNTETFRFFYLFLFFSDFLLQSSFSLVHPCFQAKRWANLTGFKCTFLQRHESESFHRVLVKEVSAFVKTTKQKIHSVPPYFPVIITSVIVLK